MIVADTSSLVTLAAAEVLEIMLEEYDVHTTETVVEELEETAGYEDAHGSAARKVLDAEELRPVILPFDLSLFFFKRR